MVFTLSLIHIYVSDYAVIGKIEGAQPGPVIALRADIDALPIHESTGLPFASENEGVMHACGHDSHIAILLGAAAILQSIKDQLHGTVKLVFQPSEEEALFPGAQGIVDSGILDDVDEIYGLHVWPQLPVGTVGLKKVISWLHPITSSYTLKGKLLMVQNLIMG